MIYTYTVFVYSKKTGMKLRLQFQSDLKLMGFRTWLIENFLTKDARILSISGKRN